MDALWIGPNDARRLRLSATAPSSSVVQLWKSSTYAHRNCGIAGKAAMRYKGVNMTPKDDERIDLRVPVEDLKRWRATAALENVSVAEWLRRLGNKFAIDQETIDVFAAKKRERDALLAQGRSPTYPDYPVVTAPSVEKHKQREARREESKRKLAKDLAAARGDGDSDSDGDDDTNDASVPTTKGGKR